MQESFWTHLETLVKSSEFVIERPRGSTHPRHPTIVYPLDYGYLKGTSGGDGAAIDVWRGSLSAGHLDAVVCTVDLKKRDAEVKLLLGCTPMEKQVICAFHRSAWTAALLVERWPATPGVASE
jgi:inorganic pyrophosphatase